ncbi:MAG: hypothetical protein ACRD0O_11765, partial [Acidimicrobiia bacterium]
MTSHRRGLLPVFASLAALGALLVPAPWSRAATDPSLQVNPEVTTVQGGTPVTLTARLSTKATTATPVSFEVLDGPVNSDGAAAAPADQTCTIPVDADACQVSFSSNVQGTSQVRAYLGATWDNSEARLANTKGPVEVPIVGGLIEGGPDADCRVADGSAQICTTPGPGEVVAAGGSEPDDTDVVRITWTSFVDARLDCDDSTPSNGEDTEYNPPTVRAETYNCLLT